MYSADIKNRARDLYLGGENAEQISKLIDVTPNTVRKWIEAKDDDGKSWDDYLELKERKKTALAIKRISDRESRAMAEALFRTEFMSDKLFDIFESGNIPSPKSLGELVYAQSKVEETKVRLTREKNKEINPRQLVLKIFAILRSAPKTKKAMEQEAEILDKRFREFFESGDLYDDTIPTYNQEEEENNNNEN